MSEMSKLETISREIFSQVRTDIVMRMRFLDMAVFRLKLMPEEITLATDGEHLYYRPVWLLKRYRDEFNAVSRNYMHVLLHCVFRHPFIHTLVDQSLWNLACDIAVEAMICDLNQENFTVKLEIKRMAVIDALKAKVHPLTAEKLYHYFLEYGADPGCQELFYADDHSIWYQTPKSNWLQQQEKEPQHSPQSKDEFATQQGESCQNDDPQQEMSSAGQDERQGESGNTTEQGNDPDSQSQNDSNDNFSNESFSTSMLSRGDLEQEWRDISEHVQMDLETFSKQQGYTAGHMQQMLGELNRERYNYEAFLKKFAVMGEEMKINDDEFDYIFYTYGLKLFKNMPLIEPLEYKDVKRIREFVIAIDTSGSTSGELVQTFLQKTYNILMSTESFFSRVNIHIVQCDADIQECVKIINKKEFEAYVKNMVIKGLGGTDFRPVFHYVDRLIDQNEFSNLKGLIYFTDGDGTFPSRKPAYETAFVFIQDEFSDVCVPPWAIKLILEKDEL